MRINLFIRFLLPCLFISQLSFSQGTYTLVVEGFDWGPAVNKVILDMGANVTEAQAENYDVMATRSTNLVEDPIRPMSGSRSVLAAYVSDAKGNRVTEGQFVTLVLAVAPGLRIGSPFQYMRVRNSRGNRWIDYNLAITNRETLQQWNREIDRMVPPIDKFDLTGTFTDGNITLTYALYTPQGNQEKYPLIIWLHGGGEGGTDASVPLLANKAANYASDEIQQYFGGAYVLSPQTPTRWMDSGEGTTRGQVDDIYFGTLKALFDDLVSRNPNIDRDRIYIGGCSNGGYMSLKLLVEYPKYFAAGYISALAFYSEYLTNRQVQDIKDIPIWFVHARDDSTTVAAKTVVPIYQRLVKAGASNVHFTYYDHVVDITNQYGGDTYHYPGHWSWIYSHANVSQTDYNGSPVKVNGVPVTIMQWMAMQEN